MKQIRRAQRNLLRVLDALKSPQKLQFVQPDALDIKCQTWLNAKEVVPVAIKAAGQAVKNAHDCKKAMEVVDTEILTTPGTPEVADVSLKSVGNLFRKPSSSPV